MSTTILWLITGAVFVAIEIFGIPGIGFLFAGIAALAVGGAIELHLLGAEAFIAQFILFFAITCISAALLWRQLKRERPPSYNNIIGDEAIVATPGLSGSNEGQVQWSGTLMRAKLAHGSQTDVAPTGARVTIVQLDGNLLYVKPKH